MVIFSSKVHKVVSRNKEPIYYFDLSDQPVITIIISYVWPLVIILLD